MTMPSRYPVPQNADDPGCDCLLITEDERIVRRALQILEPGGYRVTVMHEGRRALEALEDHWYPVCLVDQDLIDISGFEVVGQGKESAPETEFIMLFEYPDMSRAILSLTYGAYGYLEKPCDDPGALLTKIILAREKVVLNRDLKRLRRRAIGPSDMPDHSNSPLDDIERGSNP